MEMAPSENLWTNFQNGNVSIKKLMDEFPKRKYLHQKTYGQISQVEMAPSKNLWTNFQKKNTSIKKLLHPFPKKKKVFFLP
jgi:hypothetical protein